MAHSKYLQGLSKDEYNQLCHTLHETQGGKCFICLAQIDMELEKYAVDHVDPLVNGGKDNPTNFALTHFGCNSRKQDANLRVAQVLETLSKIQEKVGSRTATLADVLEHFGGSKADPQFKSEGQVFSIVFGDGLKQQYQIFDDKLSGERTVFLEAPIEYVYHDTLINPRGINSRIGGLIKEFQKGNPQLQVCLARLDNGRIKVFDGQHKTVAQLLLGQRSVLMRLFIDPDVERLTTANTNAGSKLKQVAFDKSVMHQLSNTLYGERIARYQADHDLSPEEFCFSEQQLADYFKGQADLRKYIIDSQKDSITHSKDNKLTAYINFDGRKKELPISYSSFDKAILSKFISAKNLMSTPLNYKEEENSNPRQLEKDQIIRFLNILAEEIYIDKYDPAVGTYRIEDNVAKGKDEAITNEHLAAYRLGKEEILLAFIPHVENLIRFLLTAHGINPKENLFMSKFPEPVWDSLEMFVKSYASLPIWKNRSMADTVFSGKRNAGYWAEIFETGKAPDGMTVLESPLNVVEMIK